jgi:hypothetical protein
VSTEPPAGPAKRAGFDSCESGAHLCQDRRVSFRQREVIVFQFIDVGEVASVGLVVARVTDGLDVPAKPLQQFLFESQESMPVVFGFHVCFDS